MEASPTAARLVLNQSFAGRNLLSRRLLCDPQTSSSSLLLPNHHHNRRWKPPGNPHNHRSSAISATSAPTTISAAFRAVLPGLGGHGRLLRLPFASLSSACPLGFRQGERFNYSSSSAPQNKEGPLSLDYRPGDVGYDRAVFKEDDGSAWTAVLLGWLGAELKHLKRYAELYRSRGIRTVAFVVPVRELLAFDLGRRVEGRIAQFAQELASWVSDVEESGRERRLLFHTFSNTGWFTYGAILENLQSRGDVIEKIKGCVIDSGADPEINPQVWAAGFCAALLKKRSSLMYSSVELVEKEALDADKSRLKMQDVRPPLVEIVLLAILEKIFSVFLGLPDINRRLTKIISILSNHQPPCPQLYLYSSADKVIPARSVEFFIEDQKASGRKVGAYNFVSSPHVDHYRNFPLIYSSVVEEFLKECCAAKVVKT